MLLKTKNYNKTLQFAKILEACKYIVINDEQKNTHFGIWILHFVGIWCMRMAFVQDIHYSQLSWLQCPVLQPCLELGLSSCLTRSISHIFLNKRTDLDFSPK
jgi:hypothetical protein